MSPDKPAPNSYHWCQVALHWLVALLVVVQYTIGASFGRTHEAVVQGLKPEPLDLTLHAIHNRVGLAIFGLMLIRLGTTSLPGSDIATNACPSSW
jgi:cytochrome b561